MYDTRARACMPLEHVCKLLQGFWCLLPVSTCLTRATKRQMDLLRVIWSHSLQNHELLIF